MGEVSVKERWLAAVCYVNVFVIIPIFTKDKSDFLVRHCKQGFALFFCFIVGWILIEIIVRSFGSIPVLGLFVNFVLYLVAGLAYLAISVIGFMKALAGEDWRVPFVDEFAEKVPIS